MKKILLISMFSILVGMAFGQKICDHQFSSSYKYIVKLDSSQLRYLIQYAKLDTSWLVQNKVDSFHKDSIYNYKKLPFGSYITLFANGYNVEYHTYHQHPFHVDIWGLNTTNYILLKDDEDKLIEDAKVSLLNDTICLYNVGMGSYELPNMRGGTIVKIERNGYFDYILVNPSYYLPPTYKNTYPDYSYTAILPGYISLNQPKYKLSDTVKFKAFMVNSEGKYYNEKISVWLKQQYESKEIFIKRLKPATSSAYYSEFVLGDTLVANTYYELIFKNSVGEKIKSINFYVGDYELKKTTYNLSMVDRTIHTGEKIIVVASAHDANQLPLLDGYVKLNIKISTISKVHQNKLFIPHSWYKSIITLEKEFDPSGYTIFEIPDSIVKGYDGRFEVNCTFETVDNEIVQNYTSFEYIHNNFIYTSKFKQDTLQVNYYFQAKPSVQELTLVSIYKNKKISNTITTPYTHVIDYSVLQYEVYKDDSLVSSLICPDMKNEVFIMGKRTSDSVFIYLQNPLKVPIHYQIFRNKQIVAEGKSTTLNYAVADPTIYSYYILWGHNYRGNFKANYKTQAFHFYEKKLAIELNQPEEIYPGQELNLSVKVSNARKIPIAGVNLTAYSVNTEFGEIPLPDVPYMGLIRNDEPLHFTSPYFTYRDVNTNLVIKDYHIAAMHLLENEIYKLIYNQEGKTIVNFKIKKKNPEFAVYLFEKNNLQNIISLTLDGKLIYHKQASAPIAYSFRTTAGKHTLTVRAYYYQFTLKDLIFKDSNKYIIGCNFDNLPKEDTSRVMLGSFEQKDEWLKFVYHTLFVHIDEHFDELRIFNNNKLVLTGKNSPQNVKYIQFDQTGFIAITGLEPGDIRIVVDKQYEHEIIFEPSKTYYINKTEVKSYPISKYPYELLFFDHNMPHGLQYNMHSFNQLYYHPVEIENDTLNEIKAVQAITTAPYKREKPFIYYRNYTPPSDRYTKNNNLSIEQRNGYIDFSRAWLINKNDDSLSVIGTQHSSIAYPDSGTYDLLLLNDTAICIIKNLWLPADGTFYLFTYQNNIKELTYDEIAKYELIVKRLTKIPMRVYTDTPIVIRPVLLYKNAIRSKLCNIKGTVVDALYHTPLDYCTLIAEIDGIYKCAAITNSDGDFEMNNIPPGNYMLKIHVDGYRYQIIYNLKIEKSSEIHLRINLFHVNDVIAMEYGAEEGVYEYRSNEVEWRAAAPDHNRSNIISHDGVNGATYSAKSISRLGGSRDVTSFASSNTGFAGGVGSIGGARGNGDAVFIDGMRVSNGTTSSQNNNANEENGIYTIVQFDQESEHKMQQRLENLSQIAKANRVRDNFRNYGYWVPNLITDKNGMAYFTVQFPDNITSWKTIIPAMNGNRQSGMATMVTKSYKPLITSMAIPPYLIAGDQIILKSKIINYTGKQQLMNMKFTINDSIYKSYEMQVDRVKTDTMKILAGVAFDSIKASVKLQMQNGYIDGEERNIEVKPNGILISKSAYHELINDTVLQYIVPHDITKATVRIMNSEVQSLLDEIKILKNYHYGCTEQTTSKLKALLAEKAISEALKIPFTEDKLIKQLIKRLDGMKNSNGTWGWWSNQNEDRWLTVYVSKTLNEARLAGFSNNVYIKAATVIEKNLRNQTMQDKLLSINLLLDMNKEVEIDTFLKYISMDNLSVQEKLLYIKLLQRTGKTYNIHDVLNLAIVLPDGGMLWGNQEYHYRNDEASNTLLAYDILRNDSVGRMFLPLIKKYFTSGAFNRHTLARAGLISMYLADWTDKKGKGAAIYGDIHIKGYQLKATDFPYEKSYKTGDTITISHKGSESYVNIITQKIETQPQKDNTFYRISTTLNNQTDQIRLKPGETTVLEVNVEAFKTSDNVMIEIPIPAGFSYKNKNKGYYSVESNREYFKDKTAIFCTKLPRGKYTFTIQLVPKFSGTFNLPPAKIELMYYPEVHNNESLKVVEVR